MPMSLLGSGAMLANKAEVKDSEVDANLELMSLDDI